MFCLPTSLKFLGPDPQFSKNNHFWEKGSRNNIMLTTEIYQTLLSTYEIVPHVDQLGIMGK
jgi:hypothetical protein